MTNDFMTAAAMMCPIPSIMQDVKENSGAEDRLVLQEVVTVMFRREYESEEDWDREMNLFWTDYDEFQNKKGHYARTNIWNSPYLISGESYLWHGQCTHGWTHSKLFSKACCRLTSKPLGIGAAERCWGAVKHLKKDKRAHLSAEKAEKQATIFSSSAIKRAQLERKTRRNFKESKGLPDDYWGEDDFDKSMEEYGYQAMAKKKARREFRAYLEDWEKEIAVKQDPVSEAKLLNKYGGLVWKDPDSGKLFTADTEYMVWQPKKRGEVAGYCVLGLREDYDADKGDDHPDNENKWEPWSILEREAPIFAAVAEYYEKNTSSGVVIIRWS